MERLRNAVDHPLALREELRLRYSPIAGGGDEKWTCVWSRRWRARLSKTSHHVGRRSSALTTTLAVPAWFLGLVAIRLNQGPVDNPMGIGVLLIVTSVCAIPAGILNALVVAPVLALLVAGRSWWAAPVTVHLAVLLASTLVFVAWTFLVVAIPILRYTGPLVGLFPFLGPPVIAGSVVYSILDRRSAARRGKSI